MKDDKKQRDRVIADTGWGVKPDDQPANARESSDAASAMDYDRADPDIVRKILQAQRRGFNKGNRVVVTGESVTVYDINGDAFVVRGLGYGDDNLIEVLKHLGAAFDPRQLRQVPAGDGDSREYALSRAWAWGAERSGG